MAVSEEKVTKWVGLWNGMKKEEFQAFVEGDEEAQIVKIMPDEIQLKMAQKWTRFYGTPFPIALDDAAPEETKEDEAPAAEATEEKPAGLPSKEDEEAIAKINLTHQKGIVEEEVGRQADMLDAADMAVIQKKIILTEQQQFIASLVEAAEEEAPKISVNELGQRLMMLIPAVFKENYPDRSYKWASADNLQSELHTFGGMWEIVARVNHGLISEKLFGPEGSVMYKGASVLVFTRRSTTEFLEKQTIQELDLRVRESTQNMEKSYRDVDGKERVKLEIIDKEPANKIASEPLKQDTFGPDGDYDFADTGTDQ